MRTSFKLLLILLIVGGVGAGAYKPALDYWKWRNKVNWQLAEVVSGRIVRVVNCSGTVKPVLSVHVGTVVSGPVVGLFKDFNEVVKKGERMALIDPRLYQAAVDRDEATLNSRDADVLAWRLSSGKRRTTTAGPWSCSKRIRTSYPRPNSTSCDSRWPLSRRS